MKHGLNTICKYLHKASVKLIVYCCLILFSILAILNILVTAFFAETYMEWTLFRFDNIPLFFVFFTTTIFLFLILDNKKPISKINHKLLLVVLLAFTFTISVLWVYITHSIPVADRLFVSMIAGDFIEGNYSAFDVGHYLYRYPYQLGIVAFIEVIYRVVGHNYYEAVQFLNAIAVCVTFFSLYKITKILFGDKVSKVLLILLFGCLCAMFFSTYVYGNLFGLSFACLALWMELKFLEGRQIRSIILSILFISMAVVLKNNYSIVLVAMVIMLVIHFLKNKDLLSIIFAVLMIACSSLSNEALNAYYSNRADTRINEGTPMVMFFAMGLQNGWFGKGTYNKYTVNVYDSVHYNEDSASQIAVSEIKNKLKYYTNHPYIGLKFFSEKTALQWTEPTYMSIWDSNCADNHYQELSKFTKSMYVGFWHNLVVGFMNFYQSFIWLCAAFYIILKRKVLTANQMILGIIVIGGFIFHIFWEAKSQYTIQYFILAIPYGAAGFLEIIERTKIFLGKKYEESKLRTLK